ncbi:MAG: UDP-N-acetylmuramoyl-L-alanine--D-glutamate ligase, partial [Lentisphaerae bacterium]|nr:UDP-N-acetylmuramoyl-L-alanine--D-glutamate ligase [Lentisphaerota bacterium]
MKFQKYTNALVLGLGASGRAAAELLVGENCRVTIIDSADNEKLQAGAEVLRNIGVEVRLGCDIPENSDFDVCIVSPGIN